MKPAPAASDGLRDAVNALLHQIDIGDFVDSNGHSAKMLKPVHDLMRLLSEPAADNASLRADNVRLQNEVVGPLRERVKVLEDALQRVRNDKSFHCLKIEKTQQYIIAALGDNNADPG